MVCRGKGYLAGMLLLLFLTLFFLFGCKQEPFDETPAVYMKPPTISVQFSHLNSGHTYELPLDAPFIFLPGDHAWLTLKFEEPLTADSYQLLLETLQGEHLRTDAHPDYKTFNLLFTELKTGDTLGFTLSNQITAQNGLTLQEKIDVSYRIAEPLSASYTILGEAYDLFFPTGTSYDSLGLETKLSNTNLHFKIDFSEEVNQGAVEEVFRDQIFQPDDRYSFHWENPQTLILSIEQLTSWFYQIDLFTEQTPILNLLDFSASQASTIYSYYLEEQRLTEEKIFQPYRYEFNRNPAIKEYLLMVDQSKSYLYNLVEDRIIQMTDEALPLYWGMSPWRSEVQWINPDTILWIQDRQVYTYDFRTQVKETLFALEGETETYPGTFSYVLSPDKQRLAVAEGIARYSPELNSAYISVYDMKGTKIFGGLVVEPVRSDWLAGDVFHLQLSWASDSELIYEAPTGEDRHGVALTNLLNGRTQILLEAGIEPITAPYSGVYTAKQEENLLIFAKGKTLSLPAEGFIRDRLVIDENILLFLREGEDWTDLVSYHIQEEREEILNTLPGLSYRFLGYSHDGELLYLASNQHLLMFIP